MTEKEPAGILILYGSRRGKTNQMAVMIREVLEAHNLTTSLHNVYAFEPESLPSYRYLILGSSTWNDGDLEIDFIPFEKKWRDLGINLKGHKFAIFGPGDRRFRFFCEAVRILEARCRSSRAKPLLSSLMWDELTGKFEEYTREWAEQLATKLLKE